MNINSVVLYMSLLGIIIPSMFGAESNDEIKAKIKDAIISVYGCVPEKCQDSFTKTNDIKLLAFTNSRGKDGVPKIEDIRVSLRLNGDVGGAYINMPNEMFGLSLKLENGNWKIDSKFLVKLMDDFNAHIIKSFMYFCLTHNEEKLKMVIWNKENSSKFIIGNRPPGADVGVLQEVIGQSIIIRVLKDAKYVKGGKIFVNTDIIPENNVALYSVLYSDMEFSVKMVRGETGWLIDDVYVLDDAVMIRKSQMP